MVVALGLVTVQLILAINDILEPWSTRGFVEILVRGLGDTALGTTAAWVVSVLLLLAGYRLALVLLERAELPAQPPALRQL